MKSTSLLLLAFISGASASSAHQHRISTRNHHNKNAHRSMAERRKVAAELALAERSENENTNGTEHVNHLGKRAFSGVGTYYYTDVGLGACGQHSPNDKWSVALNSAQYGGGYPGPHCFQNICIEHAGKTNCGIPILDECPTCAYGYLDLSPGLFNQWASADAGVIDITWWYEGDSPAPSSAAPPPPPPPTSTWTPEPTTSTSQWVAPSTSTTPTSTWVAPSSTTSSSVWVAPSSSSSSSSTSSSAAPSSSSVASSSASSSNSSSISSSGSVNPFAVLSSVSSISRSASATASGGSSADPSASASVGASGGNGGAGGLVIESNLEALNGLVTNYGQIMVVAAGVA